MQVMSKKKTSKLSSDLIAIISETETAFEVLTYNFFKSTWSQSSRFMKKEQMFKNYE